MPDSPDRDPVISQSLAGYLLISALLLMVSLGWALYDEFYGLRPWKTSQRRFARVYSAFLTKEIPKQRAAEEEILASAEYQELDRQFQALENEAQPKSARVDAWLELVSRRLDVVTQQYTDARAKISSLVYQMEHTGEGDRGGIREDIDEEKGKVRTLQLVSLDGSGKVEQVKFTYPELEEEFQRLQEEKARLLAEKAALVRPLSEARRKRDAYLQNQLNGLTATQLKGLLVKAQTAPVEIRQINNPDAGVVDRCESCHLGIRDPVVLTKENMGGEAAFTSHPRLELLRIHNPERFGCTPCHNGNGMQVESASSGHGLYKHWLWPLHPPENFEAGCQQCHARDMVLDYAPVLTQGKNLFYYRGCQGCHRFQGYDPEPEELVSVQQSIVQLENERSVAQREIERSIQAGDEAPDN
ncbi:MAG: hypothetical protein HYS61_09490, partial [Acidobacteria bacterium]|nr:hypothetical protein [Acidobacteriota bacterium]